MFEFCFDSYGRLSAALKLFVIFLFREQTDNPIHSNKYHSNQKRSNPVFTRTREYKVPSYRIR